MELPDGWAMDAEGKALVRSFTFADFAEAFAFLTRVALHAEKVDHHPDFKLRWNRVDFALTTHSQGGLSDMDSALAKAINAVAERS